jgi:hypothetical protein
LSVPVSRLEPQQGFSLGRTTEITRDELKFMKFITRLRNKFSTLFDELLARQLVMKGICTPEEWNEFKEDIWYEYQRDNNFDELKETELMTNRITALQLIDPFVGRYFSANWVRKHVLQQDEEEIELMKQEIAEEQEAATPKDEQGNPIPTDAQGNPLPPPPVAPNIPPPTPAEAQAGQQPQETSKDTGKNDPTENKSKKRFVNDTMEPVK